MNNYPSTLLTLCSVLWEHPPSIHKSSTKRTLTARLPSNFSLDGINEQTKNSISLYCNSQRSQIAEVLLRKHGGEYFEAHSAGLEPKGLNPLTIEVLDEIGIDISVPSRSFERLDNVLQGNNLTCTCARCECRDVLCVSTQPPFTGRLTFIWVANQSGSLSSRGACFL